jgi:hypothetical protein
LYIIFIVRTQEGNQTDLIRLDSITSLSPVEEFDPLNVQAKTTVDLPCLRATQSNPVYSFHVPPRQTAVPQAPMSLAGNGPSFKGYTSRFDTGSDPFSNLLAFTRTNYATSPAEDECETSLNQTLPAAPAKSWTTFD